MNLMKFGMKALGGRKSGQNEPGKKGREGEASIWKTVLPVGLLVVALFPSLKVKASSINDIQQNINQHTNQLANINSQISSLEEEQDLIQEEIDDLNSEILNTMTSIGMKEDEIAAKEGEISAKEDEILAKVDEIGRKKRQIEETEKEYDAAVAREEAQRKDIAMCTRLIYERGDSTLLEAILGGKGLSDILNRVDQVEKVYEYERKMLLAYIDLKNYVHELWDRLEAEKAALEEDKRQLEADREELEADRQQLKADEEELKSQKAYLDGMLARKKQESADFEAEIEKAKREAAVAKKLLQQEQQRLKQLQAAQNAQNAQNAANMTYTTTSYTSVIDGASGSDLGKKVAKYGCQYIGNPYVYGGTSLTSGTDCSGFTYRVYSAFGYTLPRTSFQQRSAGKGVSYEEAEPGDLICYEGHVGMYIGGGLIVHASSSAPYPRGGIKVSNAQYKTILAVRRIIQ